MAKGDFDAPSELKRIEDANEGVNFDKKVEESLRRSVDVQSQIKCILWALLKEKIVWVILGAFSFVGFELLKSLGLALIKKVG